MNKDEFLPGRKYDISMLRDRTLDERIEDARKRKGEAVAEYVALCDKRSTVAYVAENIEGFGDDATVVFKDSGATSHRMKWADVKTYIEEKGMF